MRVYIKRNKDRKSKQQMDRDPDKIYIYIYVRVVCIDMRQLKKRECKEVNL